MNVPKKRSNRGKTERFAAIKTFPNVLEFPDHMKGKWSQPLVVELGCGKGDYTVAMARMFPRMHCVGADIKGERIYIGAKTAMIEALDNVTFIRILIETLDCYFAPGEISELWITFPDPFPKKRQAKHRLTAPTFLNMYTKLLTPGGIVHLKTDDKNLYDYSLETLTTAGYTIIHAEEDIYSRPLVNPLLEIKTHFEKKHLAIGRKIYYICARLVK